MVDLKEISDILSNSASTVAMLAAGGWFFYTAQFKRRIQFDIDCRFVCSSGPNALSLAEVQLIFENKGFVEHKLYDLTLSAHAPDESVAAVDSKESKLFRRRVLPKTSIVPGRYGYFFVRPGVRQVITHVFKVPEGVTALRITAGFQYTRDDPYPHTARRIFSVPSPDAGRTLLATQNAA